MIKLLAEILPLQLASTLSPGIFALAVVLFTKREHTWARILALFVGSALVAVLLGIGGLKTGLNVAAVGKHNLASTIIDFVLAVIFLYLGISGILKKDNAGRMKEQTRAQSAELLKWLVVGFAVSITNFDAVLLNFTAAKEIGAAQINLIIKIILLLLGILFFTAPILVPSGFYLILPDLAQKILAPINRFLVKFGRYFVAIILLIFAVYLTYRGIKGL
jgi:threonine/homoserine/homoserine lactone efflux protein